MMYVFSIEDNEQLSDEKLVDKIIKDGLVVETGDMFLLAKTNIINIDGIKIEAGLKLEDYINCFDGGEYITLIKDIQIGKDNAIEALCGNLYCSYGDGDETYAERIYNSENPYVEIEKLIDEFLLITIDIKIADIENEIKKNKKKIKEQVNLGCVEWE